MAKRLVRSPAHSLSLCERRSPALLAAKRHPVIERLAHVPVAEACRDSTLEEDVHRVALRTPNAQKGSQPLQNVSQASQPMETVEEISPSTEDDRIFNEQIPHVRRASRGLQNICGAPQPMRNLQGGPRLTQDDHGVHQQMPNIPEALRLFQDIEEVYSPAQGIQGARNQRSTVKVALESPFS